MYQYIKFEFNGDDFAISVSEKEFEEIKKRLEYEAINYIEETRVNSEMSGANKKTIIIELDDAPRSKMHALLFNTESTE